MPANRRFRITQRQPEPTPIKPTGSSHTRTNGWRTRINRNDGRWFQVDNRDLKRTEALGLGMLPIGVVLLPGVIPALHLPLALPMLILLGSAALLLWNLYRR